MFLIIKHMQLTGILRVLSSAVDKLSMSKWQISLRNRSTCVEMLSTITSPNFESMARWSWQVINKQIYFHPKDLTRRFWQVNKHFTSGEYDEVVLTSYQYAFDQNVYNTTGWFWQVVKVTRSYSTLNGGLQLLQERVYWQYIGSYFWVMKKSCEKKEKKLDVHEVIGLSSSRRRCLERLWKEVIMSWRGGA